MPRPVSARLDDINVRIAHIESLLADRTIDDVRKDQFAVAALERFLEVISEASRHLPDGMKDTRPEIPWRRIADLGNLIRMPISTSTSSFSGPSAQTTSDRSRMRSPR